VYRTYDKLSRSWSGEKKSIHLRQHATRQLVTFSVPIKTVNLILNACMRNVHILPSIRLNAGFFLIKSRCYFSLSS